MILEGLKRLLLAGIAAAFLGACGGEDAAPAKAPAKEPDPVESLPRFQDPRCDRYGEIQLFGQYMVQNNIWNDEVATQTQCVTALWDGQSSVAGLVVDPVEIAVPGDTAGSYPAIVNGWHWGKFHGSYLTARTLGELTAVLSTWRFSVPEDARFNVEYDLWLHPTAAPSDPVGGSEVMIWVAHRDATPIGEMVDSIEVEGASWQVWSGLGSGFSTLTYRRAESVLGEVTLDLRGFLDDAIERGVATADWYLLGVEAGFELWHAASPFTIDAYEVRIE